MHVHILFAKVSCRIIDDNQMQAIEKKLQMELDLNFNLVIIF